MLNISPSQWGISLQQQGNNASCNWCWCWSARMRVRTYSMQIRTQCFLLGIGARWVCWSQGRDAVLWVPWNVLVFSCRRDCNCINRVCISITVTVVLRAAPITRSPDKDTAFSISTFFGAVFESFTCKFSRPVKCSSVVVRAPGWWININVLLNLTN